jgi:hypothetical protein
MLSALAVGSAMSSSSQRRPRAIDATNLARVSECLGRTHRQDGAARFFCPRRSALNTFVRYALSVSRPIEVVVLNCWVTDTNDTLYWSNSSLPPEKPRRPISAAKPTPAGLCWAPNKSDCVNAKGSKPTGLEYELLLCSPPSKRSQYY